MNEPLDLSRIEIETSSEKKPKEKPEKEKPKKKPTKYTSSRYKKIPVVPVVNKFIVNNLNDRFLKHKEKRLEITDCEIGEASMYLIEYYTAISPFHPALVLMGAIMGVGLKVMELQGGADEKTD